MPNGYELSAGFDNNNLLNLKIDTFERMNRVQESLNIPDYKPIAIPNYKPFVPKEFDSDTVIKGDQKLPTLKDALLSPDPKIRQTAKQLVEYQASKNPVSYGIGTDQYVPYVEGQNKFTNKNFFKGDKQTRFGYNPYISMAENEDFNHEHVWNNYSNFGKFWRGNAIFAGRALSKAVTGLVGMVGDLSSMAWNGLEELWNPNNNFWNDVSNNALSREMEKWDEHVKNQWLPTYKALNYDDKGAWEKLSDPYTWTNSFADGVGFLLQFAIPGTAFGKLGQAGRVARSIGALEESLTAAEAAGDVLQAAKISKTIAQAKNASAFTKAMGYDLKGVPGTIARTLTGSDNVGGITAHVFNTMLESVAETKEGFNTTVEELMNKGISKNQAIKIAGENAPTQFWLNTAILSFSNAFENKLLQKAIGNRALTKTDALSASTLPEIEVGTTKLAKFFEANKWGNRINFYSKNAAKSSFFEGFWEENAQTAAQRYARGEYQRQGDDNGKYETSANTFIGQLWKQTKDAIKGNDREAADSIMAGSVIGVLGNTVFSKLAGTRKEIEIPEIKDKNGNIIQERIILKPKTFLPEGQRKIEIREKAQKLSNFINTKDAWLSIKAFDADVYDNQGNLIDEKVKEKVDFIQEKISKINSFVAQNLEAQDLIDPDRRDRLQNKLFASYVKAHILNDTGDALVDRLKEWKVKSEGELSLYGVSSEMSKDSLKWGEKAEKLVKAYNEIKDIRYAAPANTSLLEYQNNTFAIHSLIFDYTAYKDMSENLSAQYEELMNQGNPFANHSMLQEYNENQIKLIKLKQKLENENLNIIDKENILEEISNLEKTQKDRKSTFESLGETKEDKNGIIIPKEADKQKEAEKIAQYQEYFEFLSNKIDNDIDAKTYDKLIKEYSDPKTGYQKYLNGVEYWDKVYNKTADEKINADIAAETKKTKDIFEKEIEDLQNTLQEATTQEQRDLINSEIEKKEEQVSEINEDLNNADTNTSNLSDKDIDDILLPPTDKQYGTDDYVDQALAYETPFKTVNKETIDAKDQETGEKIWWKEIALEHSYDHDLTLFAKQYQNELQTSPDKYELFVIKDTIDLLKERLSKKQLESFDEGKFKIGAVVVFREKGKSDWLKFKNGKTIAFSYNEKAFDYNYDERVRINSEKTKRSALEVLEFFKKQQLILEAIREKVIAENVGIPVKSESGSLGVYPNTTAGNALDRFKKFYDTSNPITVVKTDNKNLIPSSKEGELYLNIPEVFTFNSRQAYIPIYTTTFQKGEQNSLQEKIYNSIQAIQLSTFKTKKETSDIIKNYLFNFFYINDTKNFKIKEVQNGFKIIYVDAKGEHTNWLLIPRLKLSDKLYNTEEGFNLYEKKDNIFQATSKISRQEYREFIHNHLVTRRKVVVQDVKNAGEKLYTLPVNAYLNLQVIDNIDVQTGVSSQTTEEAIIQPELTIYQTPENIPGFTTKESGEEVGQADIEIRKQALKDLMKATGVSIYEDAVADGSFNREGYLDMDSNGNVTLTRFADSNENLTKGGRVTTPEELEKGANSNSNIAVSTSAVEGGVEGYSKESGVVGKYKIPIQELIKLMKDGYIHFAGIGNKEFVLSPHIAEKYLHSVNGELVSKKESKSKQIPLSIEKEKKAIMAFQGKTFTKLRPYTDIIQNNNRSLEDKIQALKEISDQLFASGTAQITGEELGGELSNLIDDLGYPTPKENETFKEITKKPYKDIETGSLEDQLILFTEQLQKAEENNMETVKKMLISRIDQLKKQIEAAKEKDSQNPIERLRAIANQLSPESSPSFIVPHIFEGNSFKIDFDNDKIEGYFENIDKDYAKDFFDSFSKTIFTKNSVKNNNISYYFIKHNRLGKFVTFDENMRFYKLNELPQEVRNSSELNNIENCN